LYGGKVGAERGAQLGQRYGKHRTVDERHRRRDNAGGENDSTPSDRQLTAKLTGARFGIYDPARARVDEWLRHTAPLKNIERPDNFVVGRSSVDDGRPSSGATRSSSNRRQVTDSRRDYPRPSDLYGPWRRTGSRISGESERHRCRWFNARRRGGGIMGPADPI